MHVVSVAPGLAHSGLVSDRLHGVLRSRSFTIEARFIHFLACGNGGRISVVDRRIREDPLADLRRVDHGRSTAAQSPAG